MSTEIISGKTFVEESYPISDIGGGVISKGQVVRHFEKKHPEYAVVAVSSFKIDHQDETIGVRVQVKPKPLGLNLASDYSGSHGSEISGERADNAVCGNRKDRVVVALLNPGYDELLAERDRLIMLKEKRIARIDELKEKYDALVIEHDHCYGLATANTKLMNELDTLKEKLETTVRHESQCHMAYDELEKANKELREDYSRVCGINAKLRDEAADLLVGDKALKKDHLPIKINGEKILYKKTLGPPVSGEGGTTSTTWK